LRATAHWPPSHPTLSALLDRGKVAQAPRAPIYTPPPSPVGDWDDKKRRRRKG